MPGFCTPSKSAPASASPMMSPLPWRPCSSVAPIRAGATAAASLVLPPWHSCLTSAPRKAAASGSVVRGLPCEGFASKSLLLGIRPLPAGRRRSRAPWKIAAEDEHRATKRQEGAAQDDSCSDNDSEVVKAVNAQLSKSFGGLVWFSVLAASLGIFAGAYVYLIYNFADIPILRGPQGY